MQARFLLWGVAFSVAGTLAGAMVHGIVMRANWGFPWGYLVTIPVLFAFWAVPFWVALNRWVLWPVEGIVEANRKVAVGDEADLILAPEAMPDDEIGDIMRSRNEMLARLQEARQQAMRRAERLALLNAVATAASESLLTDTLFDAAVQQILTATEMDSAALFVRDADGLLLVAHRGMTAEVAAAVRRHQVGEDLPGLVAAIGEVLTIEAAVTRDPRVQAEAIRQTGYEAFVGVPLRSQGRVIGVLALGAFQARTFAEADLSFLRTLGDLLGTAVANSRLYAEAGEQARRLEQLHRAGRELLSLLGQPLTEEVILHQALTILCHIVQAKYGAVGRVDDEGRLTQFIHWGMTEEEAGRIGHLPRGVGLLGALIKEGLVIRLEDLTKDPRHAGFPPHHTPMKTFLGVPVVSRDKVYGRLYLTEKEGGRAFTEEDANLASSFANSLALGLDNLRLQAHTREAEARYRDLYEHAPDGLNDVDVEGLITSMNQTLLDWLGYSREEVVGKMRYEELLTEEGRRQLPLVEERCRREGRVENVEWELVRRDGSCLPVRINAAAVYGQNGAVIGCRATTRDVTREKELEREFLQAQKMEAIGTLAGGVAHDFNNILTVIQGNASLMQINLPVEEQQHALQEIAQAVERAAGLTRQFLLFSRGQVMQLRRLDLNEVVTSLAKMLRRILGEDVRLELNLHPAPLFTHADAGMLDQVLMNLAVNARDAMPKGGRLVIETAEKVLDAEQARLNPAASPGRHVWVSVSDTGGGIPPEILPRIFEPFFTTKETGKGTGLGLATVFGIVKQHQGWLQVASQLGKGTTFQIFLPASAAATDEPAQAAAKAKPRGGSETILVVEDERPVREVTRMLLERHGYRVLEAANGVEALQIWREQGSRIDLLLTDLVMPGGVDGRELAAQLWTQQPGLKVIFTSGYSADLAGRELTLQAGQNFLQKPCPPQQFLETVRTCLDS